MDKLLSRKHKQKVLCGLYAQPSQHIPITHFGLHFIDNLNQILNIKLLKLNITSGSMNKISLGLMFVYINANK